MVEGLIARQPGDRGQNPIGVEGQKDDVAGMAPAFGGQGIWDTAEWIGSACVFGN